MQTATTQTTYLNEFVHVHQMLGRRPATAADQVRSVRKTR